MVLIEISFGELYGDHVAISILIEIEKQKANIPMRECQCVRNVIMIVNEGGEGGVWWRRRYRHKASSIYIYIRM